MKFCRFCPRIRLGSEKSANLHLNGMNMLFTCSQQQQKIPFLVPVGCFQRESRNRKKEEKNLQQMEHCFCRSASKMASLHSSAGQVLEGSDKLKKKPINRKNCSLPKTMHRIFYEQTNIVFVLSISNYRKYRRKKVFFCLVQIGTHFTPELYTSSLMAVCWYRSELCVEKNQSILCHWKGIGWRCDYFWTTHSTHPGTTLTWHKQHTSTHEHINRHTEEEKKPSMGDVLRNGGDAIRVVMR